jgi:RNA polymerase sigma-70 factor (ECF subfamily)
VAQATWTKLLEKHGDGHLDDIELPGLAIVQARFLALNEMRRDQTEKRVLQVVDGSSQSRDVEREVISRVELETAIEALSKCSPQVKKIFRMVYGHPPHSHAQVAREVGLSLQRVRQILCETRKTLRASISEGGAA